VGGAVEALTVQMTDERRFELVKLEMGLLQGVFDKYDTMIFQSRTWFATVWMATLSLAFTARVPTLMLMAAGLAILYWILEGLMRYQYWYKYVLRYRVLRKALNEEPLRLTDISVYDLSNHYEPKPSEWKRLRQSFGKLEPSVLYALLSVGAILIWWLVRSGMIPLSRVSQGQP
jgi:hypothetical protein